MQLAWPLQAETQGWTAHAGSRQMSVTPGAHADCWAQCTTSLPCHTLQVSWVCRATMRSSALPSCKPRLAHSRW